MSGPLNADAIRVGAAQAAAPSAAGWVPNGAVWFDGSSDYLYFDPSTPTNQIKWTVSFWAKQTIFTTDHKIFNAGGSNTGRSFIQFDSADTMTFGSRLTPNPTFSITTTPKYRDPTAWANYVVVFDSANSNENLRLIIYRNGILQENDGSDFPGSSEVSYFNTSGTRMRLGTKFDASAQFFDGYLSEVIMLDGQASYPTDFGQFDSNGVWVPVDPSGLSFGNNGFWLDFADSTDLGNDVSGKDNHWTAVGMTASNWTYDRPADDSSSGVGNHCTWNPLDNSPNDFSSAVFAEGNTKISASSGVGQYVIKGTMGITSGKWYWRVQIDSNSAGYPYIGMCDQAPQTNTTGLINPSGWSIGTASTANGDTFVNGVLQTNNVFTYSVSDYVDVAYDYDAAKLWFGQNGTWDGDPAAGTSPSLTSVTGDVMFPALSAYTGGATLDTSGGTAPTGFSKLNTANLPAPTITKPSDHFLPIIYEGNGTGQRVGDFVPFTDSHTVNYSARFDEGSTQYMTNSTWGTSTDTTKWTMSMWVKRGNLGKQMLVSAGPDVSNQTIMMFTAADLIDFQLYVNPNIGRVTLSRKITQADGWVNLVFVHDSSNGTAADRMRIYINGVRDTVTSATNDPSGNYSKMTINGQNTVLGYDLISSADPFDGYMSEVIFVDGYALDAAPFGQTDTSTNRWIPKEVTAATLNTAGGGTSGFGTNGFYLNMADKNDLGDDESGNGRDFTETNMDMTNGSNQMYDTPTRNTAVWNAGSAGSALSFSAGNLNYLGGSSNGSALATMGISSGKFYWEWNWVSTGSAGNRYIGIAALETDRNQWVGKTIEEFALYGGDGSIYTDNTQVSYDSAYAAGDRINIALDMDAGNLWFGKNGTWLQSGNPSTGANPSVTGLEGTYYPAEGSGDVTVTQINFGQWLYFDGADTTLSGDAGGYFIDTVPTGFKALNQDNLSENTAGITGFAWFKERDGETNHLLWDRVNGIYKYVLANTNDMQGTDANGLQRFLQQGAQVGDMSSINDDGDSMVLWQWVANGTSNPSVNTTAAFSVAKYTGNGTGGNTVTHSLGVEPEFILVKKLAAGDDSNNRHWAVYHGTQGATKYSILSDTHEFMTLSTYWNDATPGTSTFTVGTDDSVNGNNASYVAYCWAGVEGYSKFGSYTGNGDPDGPYIPLLFKPRYILIKCSSHTGSWLIYDTVRQPYNPNYRYLLAQSTADERTTPDEDIDILAGGVKCRSDNSSSNSDGRTYVYAAFAENPFGGSGVAQGKAG